MKVNKKRVAFYLEQILLEKHFEINLHKYGIEITREVCDNVIDQFIRPMLKSAQRCVICEVERKKRSSVVVSSSKPSEIKLTAETIADDELWRALLISEEGNKNLVICLAASDVLNHTLARKAWDPQLLSNLNPIVSNATLKFCANRIADAQICYVFYRSALGLSLSIHANEKELKQLFIACVRQAQFTGKALEKELRG